MKKFLLTLARFSAIALMPFVTAFAAYIIFDPFKIIYSYSDFSYPVVTANRDYISTEMYLRNHEKYGYNSFILGSSRTIGLKPASWATHLPPNSQPYMFDASGESVYGIYTKLNYLDKHNAPINNVFILLCRDAAFNYTGNHDGHLFIKHPAVSGESTLLFHMPFLKSYFSPVFIISYFTYAATHKRKPFMAGVLESRKITFDTVTNEFNIIPWNSEIKKEPEKYYRKRSSLFYKRQGEQVDSVQRITAEHVVMLNKIKAILEKHNTHYRVVLSPLYEQTKFHPKDFAILKKTFGNHLYDFTGKNSFTDSITNYFETSHFRPHVGDSIFNAVYK